MANRVTFLVHGVHLCPYLGVWYVLRGVGRQVASVTRPLVFHRKCNQGYTYEAPTVLRFLCVDVPVDRNWGYDAHSHGFCIGAAFFVFRMGDARNTHRSLAKEEKPLGKSQFGRSTIYFSIWLHWFTI
jgi:hypothetical protein